MDIQPGSYLFAGHTFSQNHTPQLCLLDEKTGQFCYVAPRGHTVTLEFDTTQRLCTGWHDLETKISYPCPTATSLPQKYQQCRPCQKKTGFNPAFYNAQSISPQQQVRNAQPHALYLAYFAPGIIKVGISFAGRGITRLLDQGARSGIILKTFPTAEEARRYEAAIASLPGFVEMLQTRQKQNLLKKVFDPVTATTQLQNARDMAAKKVGTKFEPQAPLHLDSHYFGENKLLTHKLTFCAIPEISGTCLGMIGSAIVCEQDDTHYCLFSRSLAGYKVRLSFSEKMNSGAPRQISLL